MGLPSTRSPSVPYAAIKSQISISGQDVAERRVANQAKPSIGRKLEAMPGAPGCPDTTTDRTIRKVGKTDPGAAAIGGQNSTGVDTVRLVLVERQHGELPISGREVPTTKS